MILETNECTSSVVRQSKHQFAAGRWCVFACMNQQCVVAEAGGNSTCKRPQKLLQCAFVCEGIQWQKMQQIVKVW